MLGQALVLTAGRFERMLGLVKTPCCLWAMTHSVLVKRVAPVGPMRVHVLKLLPR